MTHDAIRAILATIGSGELPANVGAMRLMMESASPGDMIRELGRARDGVTAREAARLQAVSILVAAHPDAFAIVKSVMAEARHDRPTGSSLDAVEAWRDVFDRLAGSAPDAASALYGLGSPDLMARATEEVVALMLAWDLVRPDTDLVEIGCGSGRFVEALAPLARSVIGLDMSVGMLARAKARCAGLANVRLLETSGRDLAVLPDESADLVLAADVFPYLVAAEGELAADHVAEAARILRPGGALLVLNHSYRGDLDRDRRDLVASCARASMILEREAPSPFRLWDAPAFLVRKAGR